MLKERPYTVIFCATTLASIFYSFTIRAFELPYYTDEFEYGDLKAIAIPDTWKEYQDYTYIWNGWWLVMVTMSTVGFRSYYPVTHMGRLFTVFACFTGIFIVSIVMVALRNSK